MGQILGDGVPKPPLADKYGYEGKRLLQRANHRSPSYEISGLAMSTRQ
jgi:hypothetical protein